MVYFIDVMWLIKSSTSALIKTLLIELLFFQQTYKNIFLSVQTYRYGSTESPATNILFLIPVAQFEGPTTTKTLKNWYYFVLVILRIIIRMNEIYLQRQSSLIKINL